MENAFENPQVNQKDLLLNELMITAKENRYIPEQINALTGSALEELRDQENFEVDSLQDEQKIQKWTDALSPYTQTLAKEAYQSALAQEDQFKDFGKTLKEIFWDEFKMNIRERMRQQLEYKEAA